MTMTADLSLVKIRGSRGVFAQSAIDAVKQWLSAAIGLEAIVTVCVNFTLTNSSRLALSGELRAK